MSWFSIVLFIMQHVPDVLSIINQILALIKGLPMKDRILVQNEVAKAVATKNPDNIRKVVGQMHRQCEAGMIGCGPTTLRP